MKTLPWENEYDKIHDSLIKEWILFGLSLSIFLVSFTLLVVFSTYESRSYFLLFGTISLVILSFLPLGIFLFSIWPKIRRKNILEERLESSQNVLSGVVVSFGQTISLENDEKGVEIVLALLEKEKKCIVYFDPSIGEIPFSLGNKLILGLVKNVICSYEVIS